MTKPAAGEVHSSSTLAVVGHRPFLPGHSSFPLRAFTLIELMVAIAIGALLMMTAIPAVRAIKKPPLVRAVNDFVEACREARARAVLTGQTMQVVIHNGGSALGIEPAPVMDPTAKAFARAAGALPPMAPADESDTPGPGARLLKPMTRTLPDDVAFSRLIVNLRDRMQDDTAAIKFYPNGTSDQLDAEITWERREFQQVSLEVITGLPIVSAAQ